MPRWLKFASRRGMAPKGHLLAPLAILCVAGSVVLAGGCFEPRYESGRLQCAAGDVCPRGFRCATDNRCWRDGEAPVDAGLDGAAGSGVPPRVVQAATASPSPVLGTTTALSALGDDPLGENNLIYTWSLAGPPSGVVGFSDNATNTAKNTIAVFTTAGHYSFTVTLTNREQLTTYSAVELDVQQRVNDLAVVPGMATVEPGGMQQFAAMAFDQFGSPFSLAVPVKWLLAGGCGSVSDTGLFKAGTTAGVCTVIATSGNISVNASVSVGTAQPVVVMPLADAFVEETSPDKSFGTTGNLLVKTQDNSQNNRVAYLKFSLAGVPAPVRVAKLRLFGRANVATHSDAVFAVADVTWSETAIIWKNRPPLGAKLARVDVTTAPKYHEWDITPYVQARLTAGDPVISLAVQMDVPANEAPDTFESREAPSKPQLVLTP